MFENGVKDAKLISDALNVDKDAVEIIIDALVKLGGAPTTQLALVDGNNAEELIRNNHKAIAQRLVQLAMDTRPEMAHISKGACIYLNEEATGRNEARAKRQNNVLLLNVGDALLSLKKAAEAVDRALPEKSMACIEV
jgi:hypothetical protein